MATIMVRTSRAIERDALDPGKHFALIDADLDEIERVEQERHTAVVQGLDDIKNTQRWILRTVGAGFMSFIVLAGGLVVQHVWG